MYYLKNNFKQKKTNIFLKTQLLMYQQTNTIGKR
jgi:hypothetical protein